MKRAWVIFLALATLVPVADAREERKPKRESAAVASKSKKQATKNSRKLKAKEETIAEPKAPVEPAADPLLDAKAAYVDKRPESFLVDPQLLLGVGEREERLTFLNYHAGDSAVDLYVYLYRADQEIPKDWHDEHWVDKIFSGSRPAVVVFYHVGKPQASTMRVTRQLAEKVSMPERQRAMENAVMQALKKSDRAGQFEAFLVQMSIRIYMMERAMGGEKKDEAATPVVSKKTEKKSAPKGIEKFRPIIDMVAPYIVPGVSAIGAVVLLWVVSAVLRHRARYRFPEFEVEPRLGGPHAAGVGAVISFGRAAPSPAFQREQMPEYLRRA